MRFPMVLALLSAFSQFWLYWDYGFQKWFWGSILTSGMSIVALTFLITTPKTWVPDLGGPNHRFPYLSGAGRLVVKDINRMGDRLVAASAAARRIF